MPFCGGGYDLNRGSITVYLSLTLLICVGLVMTVLESARVQGMKARLAMGAESALDSVFAEYDKDLFDTYGISLFAGGESGIRLRESMEQYMGYVCRPSQDLIFGGMTFYPMEVGQIDTEDMIRAVDHKGTVFAHLVVEYMKYQTVGDQTQTILDQLGLLQSGDQALEDTDSAREEADRTDWGEGSNGALDMEAVSVYQQSHGQRALKNTALPLEEEETQGGETQGETSHEQEEDGAQSAFDRERYEETVENSMIHDMEEIQKGAFMELILPKGSALSGEKIESEGLPSCSIPEGEALTWENGLEDMGREILYNFYVAEFFPSFVSQEKRAGVQYELEYILFGRESDDANLQAAVNRLLLVREGLNILHIVRSPEKMEAALAAAGTLMGWTLIPALVTLTQAVLVGAWAFAESIVDLRVLMGGGKISLIKDSTEWNMSLEGAAALLKGNAMEGKEGENGLSYTEYLRLFLFLENDEEKYYRTMDMIQINMQEKDPSFRMEECIFGVQMRIQVTADRILNGFLGMESRGGSLDRRTRNYAYSFSVSRMY